MIRRISGSILLAMLLLAPAQAKAEVDIGVSISLPLPIVFAAPPTVVVIPGTYVYAVPDVEEDIFFFDGWWWRPWEGRWYRSRSYDSGWAWYRSEPTFYTRIPSTWRSNYRERRWDGREWNYRPIPHRDLQRNWRGWEKSRHWEKQQSWGVRGWKSQARPQSRPEPRAAAPQQGRPQTREADRPRASRPEPRADRQSQSRPEPREMQQRQPRHQKQEGRQPSRDRQADPDRGNEGKQRDRK